MKKNLLILILTVIYQFTFSQQASSQLDIDHIIIWTKKDAPDTSIFQQKGFTIDNRKMTHTGFGTGGRYIFFYNVYLELLYINDDSEFNNRYKNIMSASRNDWKKNNDCPFGLGLSITPYDSTQIPFPTKSLQAAWMKPNSSIFIDSSNYTYNHEPMVIIVPPYMVHPKFETKEDIEKLSNATIRNRYLVSAEHANGIKRLTNLKIFCDTSNFSSTISALKSLRDCKILKSKKNLMEMTFDNNIQEKTIDFRPALPIIIKY